MNKFKNKLELLRGFTIIEISIVLVILTILVAMILPSFGKVGGSEALDTTVISVMSIINGARSQAVSSKDAANYGVRILNNKLISFKNAYGTDNKEYTISNLVSISTSTGFATNSEVIFSNVSGVSNITGASSTITITILREPTKTSIIRIYNTGLIEKN
jgi:prepilin-type N-terminal cleavage/methylation domain-containing protein